MKCVICGKELVGKQRKFCSNKCKNRETNNKHQNYQAQQARGRARKARLVTMMGGACIECGYSKSMAALVFHHLHDKEFALTTRELANHKWSRILSEAEKCVLMCSNCHLELHWEPVVEGAGIEPTTVQL